MNNRLDIVTEILKFGKDNLIKGITQEYLASYLEDKNFCKQEVTNIFSAYFVTKESGPQNPKTTIYFLKPNGYFDLLQVESTTESRDQAKTSIRIAIVLIIISGLLAFGSIVITLV